MRGLRRLSQKVQPLAVWTCLALQGCSGMLASVGGGMTPELARSGVAAPAQILEIWDTGWTINDNPVIGMTVRVQPADRPPFEARIEKTTISRIAIPQFQPGQMVMVRFDPQNPAVVAVDPGGEPVEPPQPATPSTGNAYRDHFVKATTLGAQFLPAPPAPAAYLGTADSAADAQALYENDYGLIGGSDVRNGQDPQPALDQGRALGAALVVLYGHFVSPAGASLAVLPFRPRPVAPGAGGGAVPILGSQALVSGLAADEQVALYWGKTRPAILGIVSRPLTAEEQSRLGRQDGIVVESVAIGSPAEAAGLVAGDLVVAIDGKALADPRAVPALVTSLAGKKVQIDLLRGGSALSVAVQLNPATP